MGNATVKSKTAPKSFIPPKYKEKKAPQHDWPKRDRLDEDTYRELRRKNICFNCKEPWEPIHHRLGNGKIHYVDVLSNEKEKKGANQSTKEEPPQKEAIEEEKPKQPEEPPERAKGEEENNRENKSLSKTKISPLFGTTKY